MDQKTFTPLDAHYASLLETDPLLRAAAESLYERKGNPYSNPEPVVNTKYWRHHREIDFSHEATSTLVDAMVSCDYAPANSPYADKRRIAGGLKLLGEDKIMFHRLLSHEMHGDVLPHAQEIVLLKEYEDTLKKNPNDLSPTLSSQLSEVREGIERRCTSLASAIGPAIERCNVRALPAQTSTGRG